MQPVLESLPSRRRRTGFREGEVAFPRVKIIKGNMVAHFPEFQYHLN